MLECICAAAMNSEMLRLASLRALEHAKTLTNCNSLHCFDEITIPTTASVGGVPVELFVLPVFVAVLYITRPRQVQTQKQN